MVEEAERIEGLGVLPVGVVEKKQLRIIHDLIFKGHQRGAGGGAARSVNASTDWEQVPSCGLDEILNVALKRILELRAKFAVGARILIQTMEVKSVFRQVGVGPDCASCFAYSLRYFLFVHFRL